MSAAVPIAAAPCISPRRLKLLPVICIPLTLLAHTNSALEISGRVRSFYAADQAASTDASRKMRSSASAHPRRIALEQAITASARAGHR